MYGIFQLSADKDLQEYVKALHVVSYGRVMQRSIVAVVRLQIQGLRKVKSSLILLSVEGVNGDG